MNVIMKAISSTLQSFIYILLLLVLFIFIYTLLGMQIYKENFNFPEKFRQNFDTFSNGFMAVFQVTIYYKIKLSFN